jgi:hypothetical protein
MKKNSSALLGNLFMLCFSISCGQLNNHDINIHVSESQHNYQFLAHYDKSRTRNVDEYMDDKIGGNSNVSFVNSEIDGKISLDDHTTFYIKKNPGYLQIKLDKDENSTASYKEIKNMAEGLKEIMK